MAVVIKAKFWWGFHPIFRCVEYFLNLLVLDEKLRKILLKQFFFKLRKFYPKKKYIFWAKTALITFFNNLYLNI